MGGSNETTKNEVATRTPTIGGSELQGILSGVSDIPTELSGVQNQAIGDLTSRAQQGNQFAPGIASNASYLLGGGPQSLQDTISGKFLDPNSNPFFGQTVSDIARLTREQTDAAGAGMGRSIAGSGSNLNLGDNISRALAPYFMQAYQGERNNQMQGYGLDAANRQAGAETANVSLNADQWSANEALKAESLRTGIPISILQAQYGIAGPTANAFATTNTNTTGTQEVNPWQVGVGAVTGGVGLLGATNAFGPTGWGTNLFK